MKYKFPEEIDPKLEPQWKKLKEGEQLVELMKKQPDIIREVLKAAFKTLHVNAKEVVSSLKWR